MVIRQYHRFFNMFLFFSILVLLAGCGGGGGGGNGDTKGGGEENTAPIITVQPTEQHLPPKNLATFTVSAKGVETYQWQTKVNEDISHWVDIPGATSLTYQVAAIGNNGDQFQCVLTNKYGTTTTNAVKLTYVMVLYVNGAKTELGDGLSWDTAFKNLQDALNSELSIDEIWVAKGTYIPHTTDQTISFVMKSGVGLYGGFTGTGQEQSREARDWKKNVTTLSGDITGNDSTDAASKAENSYHVVTGANNSSLDGFTITGGNANSSSSDFGYGGGIYISAVTVMSITNCTFIGNFAIIGGGMFNSNSNTTVTNCSFTGNSTEMIGGGMYNEGAKPTVTNCSFTGNSADMFGGGMENDFSNPTVTNCTFIGNSADRYGGGINNYGQSTSTVTNCTFIGNSVANQGAGALFDMKFLNSSTIHNSILWGNKASGADSQVTNDNGSFPTTAITNTCIQDNNYISVGGTNINEDPLFVKNPSPGLDGEWGTADDEGDLTLQAGSPCINAGSKDAWTAAMNAIKAASGIDLATDLAGYPRISGATIDMGAYEYQSLNN